MQSSDLDFIMYPSLWLVVAGLLLVGIIAWYGVVFFATRRRVQKTVATLQPKVPVLPDIPALKAQYSALIDELLARHQRGELSDRAAHNELSLLVRRFVHEASGARLDTMTLSDIRSSRQAQVADTIETYYMTEFGVSGLGDTNTAVQRAKEVVVSWS